MFFHRHVPVFVSTDRDAKSKSERKGTKMKVYICVDDTDDLTKSTSTGKIADRIAQEIIKMGGKLEKGITRHQLLLHDDIEYTSHNSSMCMVIDIDGVELSDMKSAAEAVLRANMAESADPGLCFCRLDELKDPEAVIAYGRRAQKEVIQKQEAYDLAARLGGTVLEEYGGTGCGVIGALAGIGLRLSGCDGVFRGGKDGKFCEQTHTVAEWRNLTDIEQFLDFEGRILSEDTEITVDDQLKTALVDDKITLISAKKGNGYKACRKKELYQGDKRITAWTTACSRFQQDNDIEECYDETDNACYNCLYRRWTADGYSCVKERPEESRQEQTT